MLSGWSVFYVGDRGNSRDYFEARTLLDAVCQFHALRGCGRMIYLVREHPVK